MVTECLWAVMHEIPYSLFVFIVEMQDTHVHSHIPSCTSSNNVMTHTVVTIDTMLPDQGHLEVKYYIYLVCVNNRCSSTLN